MGLDQAVKKSAAIMFDGSGISTLYKEGFFSSALGMCSHPS